MWGSRVPFVQDFLHSPKCLHPHLLIFGLMGQFHQTIILRIFKIYIVIGTIGIEDPCEENRILQGTAAEATSCQIKFTLSKFDQRLFEGLLVDVDV